MVHGLNVGHDRRQLEWLEIVRTLHLDNLAHQLKRVLRIKDVLYNRIVSGDHSRAHLPRQHLKLVRDIDRSCNVRQRQLHQLIVKVFLMLQRLVYHWAHVFVANLIVGIDSKILRIVNH